MKNFLQSMKIFLFIFSLFLSTTSIAITLNDNGQISSTEVSRIVHVKSVTDIQKAIQDASLEHIPITMMGKQHSQGGQTLATKAIVLDMLSFNKVLSIDSNKKQVTVESGIIWSDLQKYINPYHLAVLSMQSPNIFTVGGSLSVNAHGDDLRTGAVANSVIAFHIILANGKKVLVTPHQHPDLWSAVIGGYGLLGVVSDVTLQLTTNNLYISHYRETNLADFSNYFKEKILKDKNIALFYAHLDVVPGIDFLEKMYVITYDDTKKIPDKTIGLDNPDKWNIILTPMFNVSRSGVPGKVWRWRIEQKVFSKFYNNRRVTRNNAMQKPIRFASSYQSKYNADWLQEYFIPLDNLAKFIDVLRKVMQENKVNLLNVTIRYVPAEKNILLNYAKNPCFAVVLYFNQKIASNDIAKATLWTQSLINSALSLNGNYYLPYQPFALREQFRIGYPQYQEFIKIKQQYDPKNLFYNHFFENYLK